MKIFILFLFIIPQLAICQVDPLKYEDPYKMDIDKHIFRLLCTFTLGRSLLFTGCYEHEIKRPFTVVVKAGPSIFAGDNSADDGIALAAIASGELRYYFNLNRRIKHEKTIRNFSAGYLSLEPFVISKSLTILNDSGAEEKPASAGVYINIGFQRQVKRSYVNVFFGKIYSNSVDVFDIIQGGVAFGHVIY
jgi:hypothetical protein